MIFKLCDNGTINVEKRNTDDTVELQNPIKIEDFLANMSIWTEVLNKFKSPVVTQPMLILEDLIKENYQQLSSKNLRVTLNIIGAKILMQDFRGIHYIKAVDIERNYILYFAKSESQEDTYYIIDFQKKRCGCSGFKYRNHCKHIDNLPQNVI
jgi:hypothetical protein